MNYKNEKFTGTKKSFIESISLKRAPTSSYNRRIYRRGISSQIDFDKAHYEAENMLESEGEEFMERQSMFKTRSIGLFKFYCHIMEKIDYLYLILGLLGLIIVGLSNPVIFYLNATVYSHVGNTSENKDTLSEKEIMKLNVEETMNSNMKKQLIYGCISFVGNILGFYFIGLLGTRTFYNFKKKYFSVLLSQEQGWFDSNNAFEFATKIQSQLEYVELGLGENLSKFLSLFFEAICSFIFAFFGSWKLTLVILCLFPFSFLAGFILNRINVKGVVLVTQTWEGAGGIGEEIFYNIKTIISFSNFDYELKRFYEQVELSNQIELLTNKQIRIYTSILTIICDLGVFLSFIYGRTLIKKDFNSLRGRDLTGGDVSLTFNTMVSFYSSIKNIFVVLQYILLSLASTSDYFNLYERKPEMDLTNSIEKPLLSDIKGNIVFNNVNFYYPSDLNQKLILKGININFESGKKIALIGESGCGKTTIVNLIERFYDVTNGEILLDGLDIRKYDIQYLRSLIGYVEQEPVLFNTTIRENIIFGREKYLKETGQDIDQLINNAVNESYISEFIDNLPGGLDYKVGLKGAKLSGGQKQRIAIARAILIRPKILIFDEATSALDNKSEKMVQQALDNISKLKITTIIIAHRLSTIKNSDIIFALKNGNIYEQGTHEELLNKGGYYANVIRSQLTKEELEEHDKNEEYLAKMSSIKTHNTNEEVHFENRVKEIAKSPDDISAGFCNVFKDSWNYKCDLLFGCFSALLLGVEHAFDGYIKGRGSNSLNSKYQTVRYDDGLKYAIIYLILAIIEGILNYATFYGLYNIGINLAKFYRNKMMKKYLSFHMSYYDLEQNSPGSILTFMSINTVLQKEFIKNVVGYGLIIIGLTITALIFGCTKDYRLTLLVILFLPFVAFLNILRRLVMQSQNKKSIESSAEGGSILSECLTNTKTIFTYNFQPKAINMYLEAIDYITQNQIRDNLINGIILGLTFFSSYAKNAVIFAASKKYILDETMESEDMTIIQNIMNGSFIIIVSYLRDFGQIQKENVSIKSIYSTLETESLISPYLIDNENKLNPNKIQGKIEFKHVYFAYPTHPENIILKDVSFTVMPGQKVALVGYSGCGKSTIIQLLNRFYDVEEGKGEILIDDINIKEYNLYELRKKIGLVSQEPSLFNISKLENIRYGNLKASDDECIEAAKKANAFDILQADQININSGEKVKKKGLSGGQKQKLAIARIVLKNPVILLLDEATSALDKKSEIEVQKSLDEISNDKTTIAIAHRLNTIINYDKIIVFHKGRIKEQGTHDELMKLKKRYFTLYKFSST